MVSLVYRRLRAHMFEEITQVGAIQILTHKSYYDASEVYLVSTYTRQVVLTVLQTVFFLNYFKPRSALSTKTISYTLLTKF